MPKRGRTLLSGVASLPDVKNMEILVYFVAAFFLLSLAFVIFRIIVRRDYQRKGRLTWPSIFLELLIFALHANFSYLFLPADWPDMTELPGNPFLKVTGLLILASGLAGVLIGMTGLGFGRIFGQDGGQIKQTGLHGLTRNPQIVAYGLVVLGWAVLWPSWSGLGWVALYGAIAQLMVITEEEHLRQVGGEAYQSYCERVPRYIPLIK